MKAGSTPLNGVWARRQAPAARSLSNILSRVFLRSSLHRAEEGVTRDVMQKFIDNDDLHSEFTARFDAALHASGQPPEEGAVVESGLHGALVDTIVNNRSRFPARAFSIRTELSRSESLETQIPAYTPAGGGMDSGFSPAASKLAALLSAVDVHADDAALSETGPRSAPSKKP